MASRIVVFLPLALLLLPGLAAVDSVRKAVTDDPLVRMPGTQPDPSTTFQSPQLCFSCHSHYDQAVEPGWNWEGSMMAHSARDFLFWPAFVVAAQDSMWAYGSPNGADLCLRCHMPAGWLGGRSDPPNASAMTGVDFDGVSCSVCHRMYDPFFEDTFAGIREGNDWTGYWDEQSELSQMLAAMTRNADREEAAELRLFNGTPMYGDDHRPVQEGYTENSGGQYYIAREGLLGDAARASFADPEPQHTWLYSRYHKSKFMCGTCHDVSNPIHINLAFLDAEPGDGETVLPSESMAPYSYAPIERTFSEFISSIYGRDGGAQGTGAFAPEVFTTSRPLNKIASCQDCHMADQPGVACSLLPPSLARPDSSLEHPKSGQPVHDMTGGNMFVPYVLASTVLGSPNYDSINAALLRQGREALTLDLDEGSGLNPYALLDGVKRAENMLQRAATIDVHTYDAETGELRFRINNHSGHKLITGYPEGRRMFANIRLYAGGELVHEINPYDSEAATLRGLAAEYSPNSPALDGAEAYVDRLVYEAKSMSAITGENQTFHFLLTTGFYKDNRIPPRGYDLDEAAKRLALPADAGEIAPDLFSPDEYAGGFQDVTVNAVPGADTVAVALYYQTTSREYIEFLRDEIRGDGNITLPSDAYVAQDNEFFAALRAWGDTVWQLWDHNKDVPGAAPVLMHVRSFPGTDINGDGTVDAIDVQLAINGALGFITRPYNADANHDGAIDAVDVQLAINAALGLAP